MRAHRPVRTVRDVANATHSKPGFPVPAGVHVDARFVSATWPRAIPLPESAVAPRGRFVFRACAIEALPFVIGWGIDVPTADGVVFANPSFLDEWSALAGPRVVQTYLASELERSYLVVPWHDSAALRAAFDAGFRSVVEHPTQRSLMCSCLDEGDARLGTQLELDHGYRFRGDPRQALQSLELFFASDEQRAKYAEWLPSDSRTFAH